MADLTSDADLRRVLGQAKTIAVLGAHHEPARPAFYVPQYLFEQGYRVLAVNPALIGRTGRTLWSGPVRATLTELREPVDIVDVFRRSELVAGHLEDLLAMTLLPKVVWLQLGVRDAGFARAVEAAGVEVVQDRCTLADHRRLFGARDSAQ